MSRWLPRRIAGADLLLGRAAGYPPANPLNSEACAAHVGRLVRWNAAQAAGGRLELKSSLRGAQPIGAGEHRTFDFVDAGDLPDRMHHAAH